MHNLSMTCFGPKLQTLKSLAPTRLRPRQRSKRTPQTDDRVRLSHRARHRLTRACFCYRNPRRLRDKAHIKYVSKRPCLICGRQPSDPHHLRFAQQPALGRKVSDEYTVPLCRTHHREVHRSSDEPSWWKQAGVDALAVAHSLWRETHLVGRVRNATTDIAT